MTILSYGCFFPCYCEFAGYYLISWYGNAVMTVKTVKMTLQAAESFVACHIYKSIYFLNFSSRMVLKKFYTKEDSSQFPRHQCLLQVFHNIRRNTYLLMRVIWKTFCPLLSFSAAINFVRNFEIQIEWKISLKDLTLIYPSPDCRDCRILIF